MKQKKKKKKKSKKCLQIPLQEGHLLPRLPIKLPTLRHAPRVASPASRHQGRRRRKSRGLWLLLIPTAELLRKMLTLKLALVAFCLYSVAFFNFFVFVFLFLFFCFCLLLFWSLFCFVAFDFLTAICHLAIVNVCVIIILSIGNTQISVLLLCFLYLFD